MAPTKTLLSVALIASASAFAPAGKAFGRTSTRVYENFGFDFAEDQSENTPDIILGEANYKQWVSTVNDNSFLNRQYNVIGRVRELGLIEKTAELGVLSKLENLGLDLEAVEKLLPEAEKAGILSLVGNNQQLLINGVAPIVVEGAPILLPLVAGALGVGPGAFYLASAALLGTDAFLIVNDVEIPFVGLPAGVALGLLLVPLAAVSGGVGLFFASLQKKA
eukprot:CAMPEP_0116069330 /NCGR_PEP_ID=MMETSP0322-20121206/12236_1 /TAXON_ID=163516 /ORGANISM="Leptocylindrus danicus var. apora, Strain B651" /LENGTH=220 /DNA_ID=CAMNT_0003556699 /DNA_START=23 /DNA_END=685 /DNA_ORIENTATION=+